mmetsp:Transcript_3121/g.19244  ORF Transcript_3121/g.19244 Transcript_3121/m.19244 type:complete len:433 (-) Transcript_3121:1898-3196(-)
MEKRRLRSGSRIPDYMVSSKPGQRECKLQRMSSDGEEQGQKRRRTEKTMDINARGETDCIKNQQLGTQRDNETAARSKFMPIKMQMLVSLYAAIQSVCALQRMRNAKTTFQAMKKALEVSVEKTVHLKHILQIHAIFPEGLILDHCEKNGSGEVDLVIQLPNSSGKGRCHDQTIPVSKWRELLSEKVMAYLDLHHQQFCKLHGVSANKCSNKWHIAFDPESVPDVIPSEMPAAKSLKTHQNGQTKHLMEKHSSKDNKDRIHEAKALEEKMGGALSTKSISQAMANERFHEEHFSQSAKELKRQRRCLERLLHTLEAVHSIFSMSARVGRPLQNLADLIHSRCNKYTQDKGEILQCLHLLASHAPEYCSISTSKAGTTAATAALGLRQPNSMLFKVSRDVDMKKVVQKIQVISASAKEQKGENTTGWSRGNTG